MDKQDILQKKQPNHKDKLTIFIIDIIERLHNTCNKKDLEEIKKVVCKIWRKYHKIEELSVK